MIPWVCEEAEGEQEKKKQMSFTDVLTEGLCNIIFKLCQSPWVREDRRKTRPYGSLAFPLLSVSAPSLSAARRVHFIFHARKASFTTLRQVARGTNNSVVWKQYNELSQKQKKKVHPK